MSDFWSTYAEVSEQEGGGGGIITKAKIETGYKVYKSGADQADTFFPAPAGDKKKRDAAKAKAQAMGKANWGIQIRAYRDTAVVRGAPATWQGDQFYNTDSWTDACKQIVVPSLQQAGIVLPWEGWCRLGFAPDPFKVAQGEAGMTATDQNGNPKFPQVTYMTEVFANEDAARTAIGTVTAEEGVSVAGQSSAPDGWDMDSWKSVWPELYAAKEDGKNIAQIAADYSVKPGDVASALSQYIPM